MITIFETNWKDPPHAASSFLHGESLIVLSFCKIRNQELNEHVKQHW
jgi:hypothetical protein